MTELQNTLSTNDVQFMLDDESVDSLIESITDTCSTVCTTFTPDFDGLEEATLTIPSSSVARLDAVKELGDELKYVVTDVDLKRSEGKAWIELKAIPYQLTPGFIKCQPEIPQPYILVLGHFDGGMVSTSGLMALKALKESLDADILTFAQL